MDRFLLCRPRGGLNDMLNQIERCCRYGDLSGRVVIVETDHRKAEYFKSAFSRYFVSRRANLLLSNPLSDEELDGMDVFPGTIRGAVTSYSLRWDDVHRLHVEERSGLPVSFDFRQNYRHRLLVHDERGGGGISLFALLRMRLHDRLADSLLTRLRSLPRGYSALHVRNTDMKTDYLPLLASLAERKIPHLFVATDDAAVLADARAMMPGTTIHSFSALPPQAGRPLHIGFDNDEAVSRNDDSILDLMTLALANTLHVFNVRHADPSKKPLSGYSYLAQLLHGNRPVLGSVLDRMDLQAFQQAPGLFSELSTQVSGEAP